MRVVFALSSLACFVAGAGDLGYLNVRLLPAVLAPGIASPRAAPPPAAIEEIREPLVVEALAPAPVEEASAAAEPPAPRTVVLHFARAQARLDPEAEQIVGEAAAVLIAAAELRAKVTGHTDQVGGEDSNYALGLRRARAVAAILIARGVARERIKVETFGEQRPLDRRRTPEAWAVNRRVELMIRRSGE